MSTEGNRSTGVNHIRGYVDAVETLDESVDVSPTLNVRNEDITFSTPPTSPSYADTQEEKTQNSHFVIALTNTRNVHGEPDSLLEQSNTKMPAVECPQLDNSVEVSPADCSGDDNSVSMKHTDVISDYAVDVIESHPPYQNNVLDLSEESVTQSNHCSQSESMKGGHSDTGSLSVPSPPFQTMKRAGSLPSTLLRSPLTGTEAEQMVEAAVDADTEHIRDGLGVVNDIPSPHKQTSKSSAKSKKRTTDRKRKGSSWYNHTRRLSVLFFSYPESEGWPHDGRFSGGPMPSFAIILVLSTLMSRLYLRLTWSRRSSGTKIITN